MMRFVLRRQVAPEPTSRIPLAWGDYRSRYIIGTVLLIAGAALVAQTTAYTITLGLLGSALHLTGWAIQPARRGVRAAVAVPSMLGCWAMITGPKSAWLLTVPLICWLIARRRPFVTWVVVAIPLSVGFAISGMYSYVADKTPAFLFMLAAIVFSAWLAREYALRVRITA